MKIQKENATAVESTLAVADEIATVPAPAALKGKIMQRVKGMPPHMQRPAWLRPTFAAAAAVVILAVNLFTIQRFAGRPGEMMLADDPMDAIRTAYALNPSDY